MSRIYLLHEPLRSVVDVLHALNAPSKVELVELQSEIKELEIIGDIASLNKKACVQIDSSGLDRSADKDVARGIHEAFQKIREYADWLLSDGQFWDWCGIVAFRDYSLKRWCGGDEWLSDGNLPQPGESQLKRFICNPRNTHSQARHVVQRLYIAADCSFRYDGTYDHLGKFLDVDLDIASQIFERQLGLSPLMAVVMADVAGDIGGSPKTPGSPAVSPRTNRRNFFKQVNFLASTVSLEFLPEDELRRYFDEIAREIS